MSVKSSYNNKMFRYRISFSFFISIFLLYTPSIKSQDLMISFDMAEAGQTDSSINMGQISRTNGSAVSFSWSGSAGKVSVENGGLGMVFHRPVTIGGTTYEDTSFSKHLLCKADDTVSTPQRFTWTFAASRKASYGYFITISNFTGTGSFYGAGGLETGTDYQILSIVNNNPPYIQNEGFNSPYGENINIANNLLIWVTGIWDSAQANAANRSRMYFYNATNMALIGFSIDQNITQNATVNTFKYGIHDAHAKDPGTSYRLGPVLVWTNGTKFPVWPGGSDLHSPTNFSPAGVSDALTKASDGDSIILPATNSTWTSGVTVSGNNLNIYGLISSNSTTILADGVFTAFTISGNLNTVSNLHIYGDGSNDEADGFLLTGDHNWLSRIMLRELNVAIYARAPGLISDSSISDSWRAARIIFDADFYDSNYPLALNSTNVWVIEDCNLSWTSAKNQVSSQTFISSQVGQSWIVRHCDLIFDKTGADVAPMFDYHGDSSGLSRPGVIAQIYKNNITISASGISGQKFADLRGSRSMVYSNIVTGAQYDSGKGVVLRKDSISGTSSWLVNNTYVWENYDGVSGTHAMAVTAENGLSDGVEFFTSIPSPLVQLAYPHPIRSSGSQSPITVLIGEGIQIKIRF